MGDFFEFITFSVPRLRLKFRSISMTDDSSSVSLAEDIGVQAVVELPLLSEELEEWPNPRDNEEPTGSIGFRLRLIPFEDK